MLTVKQLGKRGRFGNQLFQYAHLRQRAGSDYQCPAWIGQRLFGLNDPPVTTARDIGTRFPHDATWYDKQLFQSLFQPVTDCIAEIQPHIDAMRPIVGVHLRRGDYGTFKRKSARWCFVAPVSWYAKWLNDNINPDITVFVASDDPDIELNELNAYRIKRYDASYWWDFYTLTQSDYMLISNSTFSYAASMLNVRCKSFWRPRLSEQKLIQYEPWDSRIVLTDEKYAA